jgi:hypothetical protein
MKASNILETIGRTPHVRIRRLFGPHAQVWVKNERANPSGSIKDRIAQAMVEDAEQSGQLKPGGTIIERYLPVQGYLPGSAWRAWQARGLDARPSFGASH